jgi:molecular chaperone GrpE
MQNKENNEKPENTERDEKLNETDIKADNSQEADEKSSPDKSAEFEAKNAELNDKYLRLYSDFDNYRKRSVKERADLIKTAGEEIFRAILPVIDDFERAIKANEAVEDAEAIKKGMQLIYNKLKNATQQKGLVAFESKGEAFNPDVMEAITHVPAGEEKQKGTVIDEVEKGYKLGDKVIRFAKVVVAQ